MPFRESLQFVWALFIAAFKALIATWLIKPLIKKLIIYFGLISQHTVTFIGSSNVRRAPQTYTEGGIHVAITSLF